MKHIFSVLCLGILIFGLASCEKENTETPPSITGSWELRTTEGGLNQPQNFSAGNGNVLKFTATTYQKYVNGQLAKSGNYTLIKDSFPYSNRVMDRVMYDNDLNPPFKTFVEISENKLTVYDHTIILDGLISKYVSIENYK